MTSFTIFGSGNMGTAIAGVVAAGGSSVEHIGSQDAGATVNGDIVVLAVPYPALQEIAGRYGDQLAGKIVVDITNPLDFDTFDSLVVPANSSATAELAAALPSSRVLKAFNTSFAATLGSKAVGPNQTTVLIAGDDAAAKDALAAAVKGGGVDAVDAGSLTRARELEAMGFLQLTLAAGEKIQWTGGFGLVRQ
ncbi:NADPH-dependent F420 reductase [Arthrobacter sp. H41]|uniref:NADPH-dependent F420 reductase n=1 Tax=Arthrobacter sp. H41 TaxID=1312978 RepID=UPI0004788828|nr:NAD(P)-binding domain-containing protein [Arthrobacter sp. H41]